MSVLLTSGNASTFKQSYLGKGRLELYQVSVDRPRPAGAAAAASSTLQFGRRLLLPLILPRLLLGLLGRRWVTVNIHAYCAGSCRIAFPLLLLLPCLLCLLLRLHAGAAVALPLCMLCHKVCRSNRIAGGSDCSRRWWRSRRAWPGRGC